MKFYRDKYSYFYDCKIWENKLAAIYCRVNIVIFFKNGIWHNNKNASYIHCGKFKNFYLNTKYYGNQKDFTKQSWRRFCKLQVFL